VIDKELTFDQAVAQAHKAAGHLATPPANTDIIELTLHPDGLWTVRWTIENDDVHLIHEEPLNPVPYVVLA